MKDKRLLMNTFLLGSSNLYGLMIGIGAVGAILTAYFIAKKRGYYDDIVFDLVLCCIPLGIIGARVYYIVFDIIANNNAAEWTAARIFGFEGGLRGIAIYGAIIGGAIGAVLLWLINRALYKRDPVKYGHRNVTLLQIIDIGLCVVLLGQGIGRWGNFFNQEAYGNFVTDPALQHFPYAVYIDAQSAWHQATFFYESVWDILGFALLVWAYAGKFKSFDGFISCGYCVFYGLGRMMIEGLRTDSLWLIPGTVRVSQLLSAILVFVGLAAIVAHIIVAIKKGKQPFIFVSQEDLSDEYLGYDISRVGKPSLQLLKPGSAKKKIEFYETDDSDRYWEMDGDENAQDGDSPADTQPDDEEE